MTDADMQRIEKELVERRIACELVDAHEGPMPNEEKKQFVQEMYADWIKDNNYEKEAALLGFAAPAELSETVSRFIQDKSSLLLDCASGTGLTGVQLKKRGFLRIDALDTSKESLDYSREKEVYTNYFWEHLGSNRLPIEDDTYGGISMCGATGSSHVSTDCFSELIRITKPGGYIIFNALEEDINLDKFFKNGQLDGAIHKMAAEGNLEYLEKQRQVHMHNRLHGQKEYCYTFVLRVM